MFTFSRRFMATASALPIPTRNLRREDFKYSINLQTRWNDNDMYGHVNNATYLEYIDTVVNHFLINKAGLVPTKSPSIGLCVETMCQYYHSVEYPDVLDLTLRVGKLGNSSVKWEVGIFSPHKDECAAFGHSVHVFVDQETRRPQPLAPALRKAIEELQQASLAVKTTELKLPPALTTSLRQRGGFATVI